MIGTNISSNFSIDTNKRSLYNKECDREHTFVKEVSNLKKLWQQYSFVFILFTIGFASVLILASTLNKSEDYIKVTVQDGESLWKIADKFSESHSMSVAEFVNWVEKENGISGEAIYPGDQLVIPVKLASDSPNEITAFAGE